MIKKVASRKYKGKAKQNFHKENFILVSITLSEAYLEVLNNQLEISVAVQKLLPKDTKCLSYINGNSNEINNISDIE